MVRKRRRKTAKSVAMVRPGGDWWNDVADDALDLGADVGVGLGGQPKVVGGAFEMSNGLPDDFCLSTRLLLDASAQLLERTTPRTTRPLRSTPITGASSLLRAGPPAC